MRIEKGQAVGDATAFAPDRDGLTVTDKPEKLVFTGTLTNGAKVVKTYSFSPDSYGVGVSVRTEDGQPLYEDIAAMSLKEKSSYVFRGPFVYNKSLEQIDKLDQSFNAGTAYRYAGFDEGYFSVIMVPQGAPPGLLFTKLGDTPVARLMSQTGGFDTTLYFMPNKISLLKTLGINATRSSTSAGSTYWPSPCSGA
jgi:hypothetical protein